jgi:cysteine desulfurase
MPDLLYLDNNATTRPLPAVVDAVALALREGWANPSSIHRPGTEARRSLELARESVARLIGCQERELIFCSGGTESINLAFFGTMENSNERGDPSGRRPLLVTSRLEHSAVRESAEVWGRRGGEVVWTEHRPDGSLSLDWLADTLQRRAGDIALVSLMWVNNETGLIHPIREIAALCRAAGVRLHVDATQAVGRMPVDVAALQLDLLSFAAHKFHGPKGVGGLYVRRGVRLARQVIGGPQERDRRGGTENVPGIVGMGIAADGARHWLAAATDTPSRSILGEGLRSDDAGWEPRSLAELTAARDRFEQAILARCGDASVNAHGVDRLWTTTNIAFSRLEAEAILLLLSERGLCASAGAACSSGSLDPSPVLLAMGVPPERAHGSIRFSLARHTTDEELDRAAAIVESAITKLRRSSGAAIG